MKKSQFETLLSQLKALAEKFAEFGTACNFQLSHHTRIGTKPYSWENDPTFREEGREVTVYFGDNYKSWSVTFSNLAVKGYNNSFELPWNMTTKEMREIFADANALFDTLGDDMAQKVKDANRVRVEKEIKEMETKLETLKNSIHENVEQSN